MLCKILLTASLAIVLISTPNIGFAEAPSSPKPEGALVDGVSLSGINAFLSRDENTGAFYLLPENQLTDGKRIIKPGTPIEILRSSSLQSIKKVYQDEPLRLRVWGQLTNFDKTNYAYISYLLSIAEQKEQEPIEEDEEIEDYDDEEQIIPSDMLSRLRGNREQIDTKTQEAFETKIEDTIYTNRTGIIKALDNGKFVFIPDSLGQNVEKAKYYIHKSATLENTISYIGSSPAPIRLRISAILTEYEGESYLLLHRAVQARGRGNFTKF